MSEYQVMERVRGKPDAIKRVSDGKILLFDPADPDWQEYVAWVDAGNEPVPAQTDEKT